MPDEVELQDMHVRAPESLSNPAFTQIDSDAHTDTRPDPAVATWAYASALLLATLSLPLLLFPRALLFLALPSADSPSAAEPRSTLTPLECFLATHLGVFVLAYAVGLVLNVSSTSPIAPRSGADLEASGHPLLAPLTGASSLLAFISYNAKHVGSLSFVVFLVTATIGLWGLWAAVFQGTARTSRKTGADKHTSAFLFHNQAAASAQKKAWNKNH